MVSRDEVVQAALDAAWKDSVRLGPAEQAGYVYRVLGGRLAAATLGLKDTRTLQSWGRGGPIKNADHEHRLQLLYRVTAAIEKVYSPAVAAAFLRGSNPNLDDRAPMVLIADGPTPEAEAQVVAAAEALLEA
jgi:hypothetical protein